MALRSHAARLTHSNNLADQAALYRRVGVPAEGFACQTIPISLSRVAPTDNSAILMLSTHPHIRNQSVVFVSNLLPLLKERGKTQDELSDKTGLSPDRISKLVHRRLVHRIVADTAIRVCLVLSGWPRVKDKQTIRVGLDALFTMKAEKKSNHV